MRLHIISRRIRYVFQLRPIKALRSASSINIERFIDKRRMSPSSRWPLSTTHVGRSQFHISLVYLPTPVDLVTTLRQGLRRIIHVIAERETG